MTPQLQSKLDNLPSNPGVYKFLNASGKMIYIGKAKNLRNRVRSYFTHTGRSPHIAAMIKHIGDLQLVVTDTEVEALILENNLVKEHQPRYNVLLKDDKSFPYIKITNELIPRIYPTRRLIRDGSQYFGPYTDAKSMRGVLRFINQCFKMRSCKLNITKESILNKKHKICLDVHIGKCDGPCEGLVSPEDYGLMVKQVQKFLRGRMGDLLKETKTLMEEASNETQFELAGYYRDRIIKLQSLTDKQKIVSEDERDRDIIAAACGEKDAACTIFCIRAGKITSTKQMHVKMDAPYPGADLYAELIKRYYENEFVEIPPEIMVEYLPEDAELLTQWLGRRTDVRVSIILPEPGVQTRLFKMCKDNAAHQLGEILLQKMKREKDTPHILTALKRDLRLPTVPKRIECFDISNLQGADTVASLVVFENAKPKKSEYRKFIIEGLDAPDDFASMEQVITRRYKRVLNEKKPMPDLIMVDGGKGQLSSAVAVLRALGLSDCPIIGLAKRLEEIFLPASPDPLIIPRVSSSLRLLQRVRDEAHRFAVTFHRQKRSKRIIASELSQIKGIGTKTAEKLLTDFGSMRAVREADFDALAASVGPAKAKIIRENLENV